MHIFFRYVLSAYIGAWIGMLVTLVVPGRVGPLFDILLHAPWEYTVLMILGCLLLWPLAVLAAFVLFMAMYFEPWVNAASVLGVLVLFGLPYVPERWRPRLVTVSMALLSAKALVLCCMLLFVVSMGAAFK